MIPPCLSCAICGTSGAKRLAGPIGGGVPVVVFECIPGASVARCGCAVRVRWPLLLRTWIR